MTRHAHGAGRVHLWQPVMVVVATVAIGVLYVGNPDGWLGTSIYLLVSIGAAALAWWSFVRRGGQARWWLALGITASALGDVLYELYVLARDVSPAVSVADGPWIGSYVGVGMAVLIVMRRGRHTWGGEIDGLIDVAVIGIVVSLVLWQFWLHSTLTDTSVPVFVRVVWAAYPVLDAMLLALVVRFMVVRRRHQAMSLLLAAGVACWLASDFIFIIAEPGGSVGALLDVGWMLGGALLAAATWYDHDVGAPTADDGAGYDEVGTIRIGLAIAPMLVPGVIELISYVHGEDANPVPLLAASIAFAGLAMARAMRLVRLRDEAQQRMTASEQLYRVLAANSSDAVLMLDATGTIMNEAPELARLVGHAGVPTVGQRALDFVAPSDVDSAILFNQALLSPGTVVSGETLIQRPNGSELWLSTRAVNLLDDRAVRGIVVNVHDITGRKRAEQELLHQAFHDSLTGLANRALFLDRVEHALSGRERRGLDPAVIFLDLDGFKNVNDGLGHEAGDHLLKEVARRLRSVVRSGDTVARLGGDEFAMLIEGPRHVNVEAEWIAERALRCLSEPVRLDDGHEVTVSASMGIAHAGADSTGPVLLRDADVAMYQAKMSGKASWVVYEPTMRAPAIERLQLESDIGRALEDGQLHLLYQPVIELATNRIAGFEALVRWQHPELGVVMPDRFVPIAEQNGGIIAIGSWVLQTACQTAADWTERHQSPLTMAVNISGRQLAAPELTHHVRQALDESGLDPAALVLEITETALIKDPEQAAAKLYELRMLGVRLAIDDFGTGYSSLSYLQQFPFDILKIDRSFINTITDREQVPDIMRGLLDLSKTLHLETVAEGIESAAQLEQLRDQHCQLGQGFLFSHPLPAEEAERLLPNLATQGAPAPR
ncbi:MAG: EAL domain-containing protein [Ilumatobacteraceae bacterium]